MTQITTPLAVSIDDTAALLSLSRSSVYKLINEGRLRYVQLNGRRMIPRTAIEELLEPNQV